MTHATGGLRSNVSTRIATNPAASSASTISLAAGAVVSAVAPGHRGCDTIAISPPPRNRPASSFGRRAGSDHIPMLLTANVEGHAARADRRRVATRSLGAHHRRPVDAKDLSMGRPPCELTHRDARPEPDLEDAIRRLRRGATPPRHCASDSMVEAPSPIRPDGQPDPGDA
jgi:hypothetical protein